MTPRVSGCTSMVFGRSVAFEEAGDFRDSEVLRSGFGLHFGPPSLQGFGAGFWAGPQPLPPEMIGSSTKATPLRSDEEDRRPAERAFRRHPGESSLYARARSWFDSCLFSLSRKMMSDTVGQNLVCMRVFHDRPCLYIKATAACSS